MKTCGTCGKDGGPCDLRDEDGRCPNGVISDNLRECGLSSYQREQREWRDKCKP